MKALLGRGSELDTLRSLFAAARNSAGGTLLVQGDAGVGKTTLLEAALEDVAGMRVMRITGFAAESSLAFSALQRLGRPLSSYTGSIPEAQQTALGVASGLAIGAPPQRALVGLASLSLLAAAGDDIPTICVVDDTHLLDRESLDVMGFVARRLSAEAVAVVFATRPDEEVSRALAGVPRLELAGLDAESGATLLRESVDGELDPSIVAEFVNLSGGNPLALRELGSEWTAEELTAAAIAHSPTPIGRQLEAHYTERVRSLPEHTRLWLLVAAAESTGDASVVRSAATALGLDDAASATAERAGLVSVHDSVRFRHPLVQASVYNSAADPDRRRVHGALRAETAARGQRELAAWHAAAASSGLSAEVSEELAAVADLVAARGGLGSRARLLARAAEIAPEPAASHQLLVSAAEAAIGSGAALLARQLLERVDTSQLDRIGRGRTLMVGALCALFLSDPVELRHGVVGLLEAADEFHDIAPELEQKPLLMALTFAHTSEQGTQGVTIDQVARRVREGAGVLDGHYAVALAATSSFILDDYATAAPRLRDAVTMLRELDDAALLEFSFYSVNPTVGLWDADAASELLRRTVRVGQQMGALREVDAALWVLSAVELSRVNPRLAGEYLAQADELRRALGYVEQQMVNSALLAWQGMPRATVEQISHGMREAGFGGIARMTIGALAINEIADGEYQRAFDRLSDLVANPQMQASFHHIPELIEAAVRSGNRDAARTAAQDLHRYAEVAGTPWVRGLDARCRALLATDADAETYFEESIAHLSAGSHRSDQARTRLLFGEWLRRVRRRTEARAQLTRALSIFEDVGADAFARRTRRELAAGGDPQRATPPLRGDLTAQEAEIARMAGHGATNAEIAAALFISANTVDYHLRKVFRKLDVTSRRQLAEHFPQTT
ncbi:AAA family ATPase [Microbacterium sp. SLBN-146]|uniref:AAA family ATPase n=1 Tax=Microbacterium sp. SLBN-146 TaxID=2768457 RepID=UPI00114E93F3|nr:LuxR family transcriptional regulator [Microbacterium sp. SLBN-146]TQJ31477.1 AAA ATPase-like protein [Microbacterium sp. SLBN-146]